MDEAVLDTGVLRRVADGAAQDAGDLPTDLLGTYLEMVVDAARTGRRLRRRELEQCRERGGTAALAGVSLRALIDLYLSSCWRLWAELTPAPDATAVHATAVHATAVHASALGVLRAADDAAAALAEGFQLARNDLARQQEHTRMEVVQTLLVGGDGAATVAGRAADLGVDLASPHAVLVARHARTFDDPVNLAAPSRLERALAGRHGDANPLVTVRAGRLVAIFAAPDQASVAWVAHRVVDVLGAADGEDGVWQAATGRALPGASGVGVSYREADDALDLAREIGLDTPVVHSADLAVYRVLLRDRAAIEELIAARLGPLADAPGGAGTALTTLDAYYRCGGVATAAAARLHLSVRALTYRLQRVRKILGADPTDPAQRFAFQAAVLGARLLGWPEN